MDEFLIIGGLLLLLFFLVNYFFQKLRIPSLLAYIILGIVITNVFLTEEIPSIEYVADIGIIILFFLLGLHYPLNHLLNISRRIWKVGLMDVLFNFVVTALLAYVFGFDLFSALIIGGVAYASSSSITLKMLEDTKREHTPEAEFKVGLLIFEDLVAPVMVSFLIGFSYEGAITVGTISMITINVILLIAVSVIFARYGFRKLELFINRYLNKDFFPLLILAIIFIMSGIAAYLELSKLLGAFLAGVMISETRAYRQIEPLIEPLKNITLPFFFFWFGTTVVFEAGIKSPGLLVLLILWGLIAKLIVGIWGGKIYGLTLNGSLRAAFSLGQRGEFSVVIAALADPVLRVFGGIYIVVTALAGVIMFNKAPQIAKFIRFYLKKYSLVK